VSASVIKKIAGEQTKSWLGDVYNMMRATRDGAECLAEIFREILALSETKRSNDPKSAAADDPTELFDAQCVNGIDQTGAPRGKQAGDERSDSEDGDCHR